MVTKARMQWCNFKAMPPQSSVIKVCKADFDVFVYFNTFSLYCLESHFIIQINGLHHLWCKDWG